MLATNNGIINIDPVHIVDRKRKRELKVTFAEKGLSDSHRILTHLDIRMAEEQEELPPYDEKEYRTVIKLGSASTWGVEELLLFRVDFVADRIDNLPDVILPYMPEIGKYDEQATFQRETKEFVQNRICQSDTVSC